MKNLDLNEMLDIEPSVLPVDLITDAELARLLGITARTVRNLAQERTIERAAPGRFSASAAIQAYIAHRERSATRRGGGDRAAKESAEARLKQAQAEAAEIKAATLRGELVPAAEVTSAWASILRDVRAALLAVPSRVGARLPALTAHDIREIENEIRAALEGLADDDA